MIHLRSLASPLALAVALSLAAPASSVPAQAPGWVHVGADIPADQDVRFGVLPNGMRYAIKKNAHPPGEASLRLRIGAGSLQEGDDQRGVAHFLEHMVFNGTTNVPEGEFVRRLERHGLRFGPDTNASTGFTQTVYKLDLPETDQATVDTALFLLREAADQALLETKAIDAERGIVLSEERTRATPAFRQFVDEIAYLLRGQRVPDRLPIGLPETIRTAPRDRFVEYYNAYYRPEHAALVAVGDFDLDEMEARIRRQFGSWAGEGAAGAQPDLGKVADRPMEARIFVEPGASERVTINWVRPADDRPDSRALRASKLADRLAMAILNRRLERIAATSESPPYVSAKAARMTLADSAEIVQLNAAIRPGQWKTALAVIDQEQRRLVEHGITQAELDRELGSLATVYETAAARAASMPSRQQAERLVGTIDEDEVFTAPQVDLELFKAARASLKKQVVDQAARDLFRGNGPLLYLSSSSPVSEGEAALVTAYNGFRSTPVSPPEARQVVAWPYTDFGTPGRVVERREFGGEIGATGIRFANGVKLIVKSTKFRDDEILVNVRAGDGRANLSGDAGTPSWALGPGFTMGGLKKISFEDLRETLSSRSIGLNTLLFDDALGLSGRTRPEDFAVQMQLLAAYVSEPAWDPGGWNRVRATADQLHNKMETSPSGIYEREAAALLHSNDPRWRMPTREEMKASSIDQIRSLLEDSFKREPIEVTVIGDISVDEAIAATAATFGALPPRIAEPDRPAGVSFPKGTPQPIRLTHKGRPDQGLAMIAWPTQGSLADIPLSRELSVLSAVYRLRLTERIREEQGTTYSPVASTVASEFFDNFGFMFGRIEAPPEKLDGFLKDAAEIAADLARTPITADELERARKPMIEGLQRGRNANQTWQFMLPGLLDDPRVGTAIESHLADYQRVTPQSLQRTAQRFLRPDTAWKFLIVPETTGAAGGK